jgi:organic hydroperoxide reductase OsmC/OhrA
VTPPLVSGDHTYRVRVQWAGSTGVGYAEYDRAHEVRVLDPGGADVLVPAGADLPLSADPAFGGDPARLNPEQLLLAAAASCQLLSFLAVAARARADVVSYVDDAVATMPAADGWVTTIELNPVITVRSDVDPARVQHWVDVGHRECFIARSLRSEVRIRAQIAAVGGLGG